MPGKPKNLIGQTFNHLTPLSYVCRGDRKARWLCECICGKRIVVRCDSLQSGSTKSCGCKRKDSYKCGKDNPVWTGHEEIHGRLWCHIKRDAQKRNLDFCITIEQAWNKFIQQNRKCAVSGINIQFAKSHSNYIECTASLDRIDSTRGYFADNIQWVHKKVNRLKWDLTSEELFLWCKIITQYQESQT